MASFLYHNKTKINYEDVGKGNIILLLHGFGETSNIWQSQKLVLQSSYRVIIPDLPGSGRSDLIDKNNVTIEDYANCIYELLKHLQLNSTIKISILGHSMGGYITLEFARKYGTWIHSFGLIHSTAFADSATKKQIRLRCIETMHQYGSYSFLKTTIPNLFSKKYRQIENKKIYELIEQGISFTVAALQQYYIAMMNRNSNCEVLKESNLPVLFIAGTEDEAAPLSNILQQVHLADKVQLKVLENVAHMGMLEASDEVNKTILKFLSTFNL